MPEITREWVQDVTNWTADFFRGRQARNDPKVMGLNTKIGLITPNIEFFPSPPRVCNPRRWVTQLCNYERLKLMGLDTFGGSYNKSGSRYTTRQANGNNPRQIRDKFQWSRNKGQNPIFRIEAKLNFDPWIHAKPLENRAVSKNRITPNWKVSGILMFG